MIILFNRTHSCTDAHVHAWRRLNFSTRWKDQEQEEKDSCWAHMDEDEDEKTNKDMHTGTYGMTSTVLKVNPHLPETKCTCMHALHRPTFQFERSLSLRLLTFISGLLLISTPSVPNYKSFQESWRVKSYQSLTKIIERNTKIYDIK